MSNPRTDNTFQFSPPIDSRYLIELYAGDYDMIGETFSDVLAEYDVFVQHLNDSYEGGDRQALKSAVHKIKPLLGFVGLLSLQAECQDFENSCLHIGEGVLASSFTALRQRLMSIRTLIESEKARLEAFIKG
jgi:HPt (histidine-containing phosphotransfer) domain-containing protein